MLIHRLLHDGANRRPDRIAFHWVDRDRSLTYAAAVATVEAAAGALHEMGVRKGDRVTLFAHNGLDYLAAMFGCFRIGAIAALVNVRFTAELADYFQDHTPTVVVYTHDMHEVVAAAARVTPSVRQLLCMDGPMDGARSWPELMAAGLPAPPDPEDESAIAHLSYTSGTSGRPKGACLMHEPTMRATRCIAERLRIGGNDVSFGPTALSSSYQLAGNLLPPLHHGCTIEVMGRWTPETGFAALDASGATMLVANPTVLGEVLEQSQRHDRTPGRLRFGLSGGGPVPPTLKAAWRDRLGIPLVESYGQSELGGFVALGRPEAVTDEHLLAIGTALPDKEVRIFDPADHELQPGRVGEIVLRGGYMHGYWGLPEKTAEALRGGWLHTGDLGFLDLDGRLTLRGRRSELIIVKGEAWFPRDIEEALARQPGIRQAALIGVPDPVLGQRPLAFVTLSEGATVDKAALAAAAAAASPYDASGLAIEVVDELPMTPTGKISKAQLLARVIGSSA